jgi:hypothetical protein
MKKPPALATQRALETQLTTQIISAFNSVVNIQQRIFTAFTTKATASEFSGMAASSFGHMGKLSPPKTLRNYKRLFRNWEHYHDST